MRVMLLEADQKIFSRTKEKIKALSELSKTWYFVWLEKCAEPASLYEL